ncbi:MAG: hypothetical protein ACTSRP_26545, partial [Candidatus Helarchaeota archaeon]
MQQRPQLITNMFNVKLSENSLKRFIVKTEPLIEENNERFVWKFAQKLNEMGVNCFSAGDYVYIFGNEVSKELIEKEIAIEFWNQKYKAKLEEKELIKIKNSPVNVLQNFIHYLIQKEIIRNGYFYYQGAYYEENNIAPPKLIKDYNIEINRGFKISLRRVNDDLYIIIRIRHRFLQKRTFLEEISNFAKNKFKKSLKDL